MLVCLEQKIIFIYYNNMKTKIEELKKIHGDTLDYNKIEAALSYEPHLINDITEYHYFELVDLIKEICTSQEKKKVVPDITKKAVERLMNMLEEYDEEIKWYEIINFDKLNKQLSNIVDNSFIKVLVNNKNYYIFSS